MATILSLTKGFDEALPSLWRQARWKLTHTGVLPKVTIFDGLLNEAEVTVPVYIHYEITRTGGGTDNLKHAIRMPDDTWFTLTDGNPDTDPQFQNGWIGPYDPTLATEHGFELEEGFDEASVVRYKVYGSVTANTVVDGTYTVRAQVRKARQDSITGDPVPVVIGVTGHGEVVGDPWPVVFAFVVENGTYREVDPVSRIEGHLGISLSVDGGVVTKAEVHGNLFRGFENILVGREPNDPITFTQRICGV